ncbi:MAG: alpha/beta fold hydrolase [Acidobacteria bacterium]|nr:alpha/beta fold hydrolase [Acidobacteriota bacterium]
MTRTATRRRVLLALAAVCILGYSAGVLWLVTQETRIVFQAALPLPQGRPSFPYEQVDVPRSDRTRQFAWVMRAGPGSDARPWILYLHGNAATIASRMNISHYTRLRELGLNVFAPEYRGFGGLDGVPSEATLEADASAAYDYLRSRERVTPERIIVYGWSLGSAVAVTLASQVPQAAVILEGAPASLVAIGELQYPLFPIRLVMRNPFDSITRVSRIQAPMLFLHSPDDTVIPIGEGRRLYDAATAPKTFVEVRGGHIYASDVDAREFYGAIRKFLESLSLLP